MSRDKGWRLALATLVGGGFLWLLLRGTHWRDLGEAMRGARIEWLLLAGLALTMGYALRIRRWQLLLRAENPGVSLRACAGPLLAGFAANNVLPFRAGDVLRCAAFGPELGVSTGGATATLVLERMLDALMLVAALGVALYLFGVDGHRFFAIGAWGLLGAALALAAVLLFPQLVTPIIRGMTRWLSRLSPGFGERLSTEVERGIRVLEASGGGLGGMSLLGWSASAWLAEGVVFYAVARALPELTAPTAAWLALPVATLSTLLPGTPGYVGTFDFFAAEAMQVGSNTAIASVAFALLVHLILWLPVTLAGGAWLWGRRTT